jgi:hypothetical protein
MERYQPTVSQYEQAVASAIVCYAEPALRSKRELERDYITNPDFWPWIEEAQSLAADPRNVDAKGAIKIEAWNQNRDRNYDPMFEFLWTSGLSERQFEWALPEIRSFAIRRRVLQDLDQHREEILKGDPDTALHWLGNLIGKLSKHRAIETGEHSLGQQMPSYLDGIQYRFEHRDEESLATFGLPSLDRAMGKVHDGELIVISSEAKGGKTTLCYQLIKETCIDRNIPTVLISLEMAHDQVIDRLVARLSNVDSMRLRSGQLNDVDFPHITHAVARLKNVPLTIIDENRQTVDSIESICRYHREVNGSKLFILDYFQLLDAHQGMKRFEQLETFSRRLVGLAKSLGIVLVVISQLNEKGYTAGSRQIEKDCHRLIKIMEGENPGRKIIDLALNRWGPAKAIDCLFYGATHCFQEIKK